MRGKRVVWRRRQGTGRIGMRGKGVISRRARAPGGREGEDGDAGNGGGVPAAAGTTGRMGPQGMGDLSGQGPGTRGANGELILFKLFLGKRPRNAGECQLKYSP